MTATRFDIVNARERLGIHAWLDTTSGIVAVLLAVQFFTGILLAFYYVPSTDHAYATVDFMQQVVSSGAWIRSLHHYGSQWLALFAFLHVVRLFWREAYVDRNKQWIAAVVLLGLVMAAGGTGYSLPWDARAFFSTRIAEGLMGGLPFVGRLARLWLLGGSEISTLTLSRFFALHVLVIPALIVAVMVWRRLPLLDLQRNAIAAAIVFVALALWSLKFHAPLGPSAASAAGLSAAARRAVPLVVSIVEIRPRRIGIDHRFGVAGACPARAYLSTPATASQIDRWCDSRRRRVDNSGNDHGFVH